MNYLEVFENVEHVLRYNSDIPSEIPFSLGNLFNDWFENKQRWINRMPDLIYELPDPVTFSISDDGKIRLFSALRTDTIDRNIALYDFLSSITYKEFFNKYLTEDYDAEVEGKVYHIEKGTKIIKAFKYFCEDMEELKYYQSEASRIIQQDNITGYFCVSIHPMDYISASENISNWHSCHALDGIYKAGNLSYMADNCTLMCYLRSDKLVNLPNFPEDIQWNNKKWRMFFHVDENDTILFTSRPYPFETEGVYKYLTIALNDICRESAIFWDTFTQDYITHNSAGQKLMYPLIYLNTHAKTLNRIIHQDNYNLAYVDILFNDNSQSFLRWAYGYTIHWWWLNEYKTDRLGRYAAFASNKEYCSAGRATGKEEIKIGAKVLCPICQKEPLTESGYFYCEDCNEMLRKYRNKHKKKVAEINIDIPVENILGIDLNTIRNVGVYQI